MHAETILKYSPVSPAHRPYLIAANLILWMKSSKKSGKIVLKMMFAGTFRPEASVQHFERQIKGHSRGPKRASLNRFSGLPVAGSRLIKFDELDGKTRYFIDFIQNPVIALC
ncbi:MAG: hypothetical protein ACIAZJ_01470 [Gimesia chilikensis]|uniref:hypothetical protein n=1 Tax=Gimesia chilikensis TaxID=2605989 RepID=UPI00379434B8